VPLVAEHAALSDIGLQRTTNEDAFVDAPPLFVVADGMGGAQAGEVASQTAVEALRRALDGGRPLPEAAREANLQVFTLAERDPSRSGMGTTLTALRLSARNERAELVHVGDSRAYLLREGRLEQVTVDHSLVGEMVREGKLTPAQAFDHPARSILTRALGTEPGVKLDRAELDLRAGDALLLCSDGLSSAVPDATITRLLEGGTARDATRRLVREAKNRGGHDNITVVVVRLAEEGPSPRTDEERTAALPGAEAVAEADSSATAPLPAVPGPSAEAREGAVSAREAAAPGSTEAAKAASGARRRGLGHRLWLLVVALVVAVVVVALAVALNVSYYVGVDSGYVAVFQGLPYRLGGLELSHVYLRTQTPALAVAPGERHLLTDHSVTSKDEAIRIAEAMRAGVLAPSPSPSATARSSPVPSVKGSAPSVKGTP
jgi:serine/threonine protein phosphatase PrpC